MTQFYVRRYQQRFTFIAHFFVISSIIIVLTAATKIKSNHYSVWYFEHISNKSTTANKSDEINIMTFNVKIRASRHHNYNNALKNQYNLLVKFENVSQWLTNSNNNDTSENNNESKYGIKLGVDGQCTDLYTKENDNQVYLKRIVALLLFPEPYYKMTELKKHLKNRLTDCFEATPLGSCKSFVKSRYITDNEGHVSHVLNKHTNADYCDEEEFVYESLTTPARPTISPDSCFDANYFIDTTDNKLSRVEMLFKINYPSDSENVQNSYVMTYNGYEFIKQDEDVESLMVNYL